MEFQYYGGNCVSIVTKKATIIVDDTLSSLGLKSITKPDNIAMFTQLPKKPSKARLTIADPGEYEASEISIFGIAARGHMDEKGTFSSTIYKIMYEDLRVVVLGHVHPDLTDDELEEIGVVDILIVPVGGSGYTLDAIGALSVIKKIEPKLIIPTHYADNAVNYEVPQAELADVLKNMAMEPKETVAKFKPKPADFSENAQIVVLERQ
jgi:L-ascorbate metabolism protein UlaG (beta-lactamase superfamily)